MTRKKKGITRESKPWFNRECAIERKNHQRAKRLYRRYRSDVNQDMVKQTGKRYKKSISRAVNTHRKDFVKKLKLLKDSDPKKYWSLLNPTKKRDKVEADIVDLVTHYKELSGSNMPVTEPDVMDVNVNHLDDDSLNVLNADVCEDEIIQVTKKLKTGKSSGVDDILNEYIKSTIDTFLSM